MKLTQSIINALPAPFKIILIKDDKTPFLYLKHSPNSKTFVYRERKADGWKILTLGNITLEAARKRAASLANSQTASMTFGELLNEWYNQWAEPNVKRLDNIQGYINKADGRTQLEQLTTRLLKSQLDTYAKQSPVSANRCLTVWKQALDYGVECGYLEVNPLARVSKKTVGGKETPCTRVLSDDEIKAIDEPLLKFLLLTGLRISEAYDGRLEGDRWVIPTTKTKQPHWVHLTPLAKRLICEWKPVYYYSKMLRKAKADWTPHDLRRTMVTRLNELKVAPHVVEKMVNHKMPGVMATYNLAEYAEERVAASELWSEYYLKLTQ